MVFKTGAWVEEPRRAKSGGRTGVVLRVGPEGKKATWAEVLVVSVLHLALQPPKLKTFERAQIRLSKLRHFPGTPTCSAHELENKFLEAMALAAENHTDDCDAPQEGAKLDDLQGVEGARLDDSQGVEGAPALEFAVDYPAHQDSDFQAAASCSVALMPVRSEKMATAQEWAETAESGEDELLVPSTPGIAPAPTWEVMSAQGCVIVDASGRDLSHRRPDMETPPKPKRQRVEVNKIKSTDGVIHGLVHVRWFQGTKARQISGYKRQAQGFEVTEFPEGTAVKTFGLKNNLRFMVGDVTRVYTTKLSGGTVTAVAELRTGTFYLELSESDPAALESLIKQFTSAEVIDK